MIAKQPINTHSRKLISQGELRSKKEIKNRFR